MIYSTFVIYEFGVQERMMKGTFDGTCNYNTQELIRANYLGDWAKRFAFQYEPWDDGIASQSPATP